MTTKDHHISFWVQILAGISLLGIGIFINRFKKIKSKTPLEQKVIATKEFSNTLKKMNKQEFINFLSPSIKVMSEKTGIPYKFMMAQIALETGWGASELFYKYFNVGGIRSFHPEKESNILEWTHEVIPKKDIDNGKFPDRDKTKDVQVMKDGKQFVNIKVKLPFRSFPGLVEGLEYYLKNVLLNHYFKPYIAESEGDANKYVHLLQSGKYGAKYATALNYPETIIPLMKNFV